MIDRAERTNARFQQRIDQPAVIVDSLLIDCTRAARLNARPRSREPVALLIQPLQNSGVFKVAVVLITGNVRGSAAFDFSYRVREVVPIRFALPVYIPRPFHLVRSGSHPPDKSVWKAGFINLSICNRAWNRLLRRGRVSTQPACGKQRAGPGKQRASDKITAIHFGCPITSQTST